MDPTTTSLAEESNVLPPHSRHGQDVMEERTSETFPGKLFRVLGEAEEAGLSHIVAWMPHGRAFRVNDRKLFVEVLLPRYFGQTSYASFQRQLNLYGFHWIREGPDRNAYFHEFFLRGMHSLAAKLPRLRKKGQGPRKPAVAAPKFYSDLPWMPSSGNRGAAPLRSTTNWLTGRGPNSHPAEPQSLTDLVDKPDIFFSESYLQADIPGPYQFLSGTYDPLPFIAKELEDLNGEHWLNGFFDIFEDA